MKKSELEQIIKEEVTKALSEGGPFDALGSAYGAFQTPKPKYQVIFYDDNSETPVNQLFDSEEEAKSWADDKEYDYADTHINDMGEYEWKTFYKFYNPEDKEKYNGYEIKKKVG